MPEAGRFGVDLSSSVTWNELPPPPDPTAAVHGRREVARPSASATASRLHVGGAANLCRLPDWRTRQPGRDSQQSGNNVVKKRADSPSAGLVPVRPRDSVDMLERVLTKGAIVEAGNSEADTETRGDSTSVRVSIGGIDVLNIQPDLSWRSLDEPDEPASDAK
jgi:hypothetical protein